MRLAGRIHVEPLDEARLGRLERRLVAGAAERLAQRARPPRRVLGLAAAGALAIATALVGWKLGRRPVPARAVAAHVTNVAPGGALDLGDATITADASSAYRIARTGRDVTVTLAHGRLELAVEHRPGRRFLVRAGETEIEDVGTKFSVDYDGGDRVEVRVREGEVEVTHQRRAERVTAGQVWRGGEVVAAADRAPAPGPAEAPAPDRARTPRLAHAAHATAHPAAHLAAQPAVQPATAPPRARAPGALPLSHDHHATVPRVHHVRAAKPAPGREPRTARAAAGQAQASALLDPYVDIASAIRSQPIDFDPKIDGMRDAAAEIARLKPIAYSPSTVGPEAARAIYRIAVLLHRPLHQDAEALRTLDMYRRRFSGGEEYRAALWLDVRIACLHALDDTCRQAAYTYQHEVPSGRRTDITVRITNAQ